MSQKRAGAEVDKQWPRILKKIGGVEGGGASAVTVTGIVPWANVSKTGSSLAHLADRDHGLLTGLLDDDHGQYVHVSSQRTVSAGHTWSATQTLNAAVGLTSPDGDYQYYLGRAFVGYVGHGDYAGFAHRDQANGGGYAFLQGSTGLTLINSPTGGSIYHRIANADAMVMDASTLALASVTAVRTNSFVSGFTGNGFRIDNGVLTPGKTTGEIDDLIVRGRMRVYELLVQQIRATNGSIFVSSTGKAKTVTGGGPYSIETDATHGFLVNDLIRAQRFTGNGVYQSNLQVTAVADLTHFTANLSSGDAPAAGMEFVRLGNTTDTTRQNSIYMSADDTYNPFIDIIVGVNSFAAFGSTSTRKGRIGNLQGLFSVANEHGIFVGDGLGVTNKYLRISSYTQESHNIPNKMYDGSGNLFMQMDTTGLNYYVLQASSFADNTSVMFRRPDGTKIVRLVGVNSFGSHTGALEVNAGSGNSTLQLLTVAPSGFFAQTVIQNTVGALSSQWIFHRLASGTVKAEFPGFLYVYDAVGIGISTPAASLHVARGSGINGTAAFSGTTNTSHFNYSTAEDTYIRGGKATSRVIVNDNSSGNVEIAVGGGSVGIGTSAPEAKLHVAGVVRSRVGSGGYVELWPGDATNLGYIQWIKANGVQLGHMGFGATNIQLVLENSANFVVTNGYMGLGVSPSFRLDVQDRILLRANGGASAGIWYGDSSGNLGAFAGLVGLATTDDWGVHQAGTWRLQVSTTGEVKCNNDLLVNGVARFPGGYIGLAEQAAPATSALYAYLYVDSADGDLKVKFKNGTVRTIVTN